MRPPPRFLPTANSPKWHSRRFWEPLGYFRVRSLANPKWSRDVNHVVSILTSDRDMESYLAGAPGTSEVAIAARAAADAAIVTAKRYRNVKQRSGETAEEFTTRLDSEWDKVLASVDAVLELWEERRRSERQARTEESGDQPPISN